VWALRQAKHFVGRPIVYGDTIKLRYTKTKTLLGIDIGRAPRLEPSAKRVVMHSEDGAPVRFRVMPRFMSLAEGNTVCYGDSIQAPRPPRPAPHRAPTAPHPPHAIPDKRPRALTRRRRRRAHSSSPWTTRRRACMRRRAS